MQKADGPHKVLKLTLCLFVATHVHKKYSLCLVQLLSVLIEQKLLDLMCHKCQLLVTHVSPVSTAGDQ